VFGKKKKNIMMFIMIFFLIINIKFKKIFGIIILGNIVSTVSSRTNKLVGTYLYAMITMLLLLYVKVEFD